MCIVPVRGGSKGIPRKNEQAIVPGVSLLAWTIGQALAVYGVDDVIVSTEDDGLMDIAQQCGAKVQRRPHELARDSSTTASVVSHLLDALDPAGRDYQAIAILQVTSPLRQVDDVRRSVSLFRTGRYDSVVSAYQARDCHPAKLYFSVNGEARSVSPEYQYARRQDLPDVYRRNGAIFIVTRKHFAATGHLWGGGTGLVEMPVERSVDIDEPRDLDTARAYIEAHRKEFGI